MPSYQQQPRVDYPVMPDDAFLQAILSSPDDDTPRLAYADWLEEHGRSERAAFIRVQCQLARLPDDDPRRRSWRRGSGCSRRSTRRSG
jgi:uncharacterized protein (TIGR02996 family)